MAILTYGHLIRRQSSQCSRRSSWRKVMDSVSRAANHVDVNRLL